MDIRPVEAEATAEERAAVDALLGAPRSSWEGGARGDVRDAHTASVGGRDSQATCISEVFSVSVTQQKATTS